MKLEIRLSSLVLLLFALFSLVSSQQYPDVITVNSTWLLPEGVEYDPKTQTWLIGSIGTGTINRVSADGMLTPVTEQNANQFLFSSVGIDLNSNGILHVANGLFPSNTTAPLQASYVRIHLSTGVILASVDLTPYGGQFANDITEDAQGWVYLTDSYQNKLWIVKPDLNVTSYTNASLFTQDPAIGLSVNGIVYHPNGFLIVGRSGSASTAGLIKTYLLRGNTTLFGENYSVPDGEVELVSQPIPLWSNGDVAGADGLYLDPTNPNLLYVVGQTFVYKVQTDDDWLTATVLQKITVPEICVTPTTIAYADTQLYVNCANGFGAGPYYLVKVEFPVLNPIPDHIVVTSANLLPESLDWNPEGFFYVSSVSTGAITHVNYDGTLSTFAAPQPSQGLFSSFGVHADFTNGWLHVANGDLSGSGSALQASYVRLNLSNGVVLNWTDLTSIGPAGQVRLANDLAVDPKTQDVYVTDSFGGQIWKINGNNLQEASSFVQDYRFTPNYTQNPFNIGVNGIVFHPNGYLIVGTTGDSVTSGLYKITLDKTISLITLQPGFNVVGPDGLRLDAENSQVLYAIGNGNIYQVLSEDDFASAKLIYQAEVENCVFPTAVVFQNRTDGYVNCAANFGPGPYAIQHVKVPYVAPSEDDDEDSWAEEHIGAVIGIVVAAVVLVIGLVVFCLRKQKNSIQAEADSGYRQL